MAAAADQGVVGIKGVLLDHYKKYGRTFFSRSVGACIYTVIVIGLTSQNRSLCTCSYDYEEVDSDKANQVMSELESAFSSGSFVGSSLKATSSDTSFKVAEAANFSYTDPIDGSVSKNQGLYVTFADGSRIVFRLSGTGSSGATIRLYVEKYSKDESEYERDTQEGLKPLIEVALSLSKLVETTGRKEPTVITVSSSTVAVESSRAIKLSRRLEAFGTQADCNLSAVNAVRSTTDWIISSVDEPNKRLSVQIHLEIQ